MQEDFHYYATYCAACFAGYSPEESLQIAYSDNFVDICSQSYLERIGGSKYAATTQLTMEMANKNTDKTGLQDITQIWASFHFLPGDLHAEPKKCSKRYLNKYRLICNPNSDLVVETVQLAKNKPLQAVGIAMHVLADTWAHRYFAGTPSMVINNTTKHFYELIQEGDGYRREKIEFIHALGKADDLDKNQYTCSISQNSENSVMNLGHGRAGHLPDYSFIRYVYLPAWADYEEYMKDNPSEYWNAFCQMIYALKYLRGEYPTFEKETYDTESVAVYESEIRQILEKRQLIASEDWKAFGEKLFGAEIPAFDPDRFQDEYKNAPKEEKKQTFLGKFISGALAQKQMVTKQISDSGNKLAGHPVEKTKEGKAS